MTLHVLFDFPQAWVTSSLMRPVLLSSVIVMRARLPETVWTPSREAPVGDGATSGERALLRELERHRDRHLAPDRRSRGLLGGAG